MESWNTDRLNHNAPDKGNKLKIDLNESGTIQDKLNPQNSLSLKTNTHKIKQLQLYDNQTIPSETLSTHSFEEDFASLS